MNRQHESSPPSFPDRRASTMSRVRFRRAQNEQLLFRIHPNVQGPDSSRPLAKALRPSCRTTPETRNLLNRSLSHSGVNVISEKYLHNGAIADLLLVLIWPVAFIVDGGEVEELALSPAQVSLMPESDYHTAA
jgi:hypothetical protein